MRSITTLRPILSRTTDVARINALANHPDIRPFIGLPEFGELDFTPLAKEPEHWFLLGEYGGFFVTWSAPRVHEVHTCILRNGRGAWAQEAAAYGIAFAKAQGDSMLWTQISPEQKNVIAYARRMGMADTGMTKYVLGHPYLVYNMELRPCLQPSQ